MTYRRETAAPTASALEHAPLSQKRFLLSFARIAPDRGLGAPLRASLLYPVARAWISAFSAWWAAAAAEPALTWVYLPSAPGSASGGRQSRTGHPRRGLRRGRRATVAAMAWAWRNSSGDAHYSAARSRVLADLRKTAQLPASALGKPDCRVLIGRAKGCDIRAPERI